MALAFEYWTDLFIGTNIQLPYINIIFQFSRFHFFCCSKWCLEFCLGCHGIRRWCIFDSGRFSIYILGQIVQYLFSKACSAIHRKRTHNLGIDRACNHGSLTRYVKLQVAHAPGMPGTFSRHRLQRKPLVSDPDMHHGRCVTVMHVGIANPW